MEQRYVILDFLRQFDEVVTVNMRLIVLTDNDVAQHCLYLYFVHKPI